MLKGMGLAFVYRMVNKEAKKHPPSIYDIGETVLTRYPPTGSKIVKKKIRLGGENLKEKS